jgi:hypothetical protein
MAKLTKEELELEILTLSQNIEVLKSFNLHSTEAMTVAKSKLAFYSSKLLLLQLGGSAPKK